MDKENKKFKNVTVTHNRNMHTTQVVSAANTNFIADIDSVMNSTAKFPLDGFTADADLSTISSIFPSAEFGNKSSTILIKQAVETRQVSFNLNKLLMSIYLEESLKKILKEDEEQATRELFQLHKTHEILKIENSELSCQEHLIDQLIELVTFMDNFINWFDKMDKDLNDFKHNYKKLADAFSKSQNFLQIKNIHIPNNFDFEEALATELNRTSLILNQINSLFDKTNLTLPEKLMNDEKLDYKLIEELKVQYSELKDCILKYNGIKMKKFN